MPDIRKIINAERKHQGWSKYRLWKELQGKRQDGTNVTQQTVYDFLKGKSSLNSDDLGLIFDALGLELKRRKE